MRLAALILVAAACGTSSKSTPIGNTGAPTTSTRLGRVRTALTAFATAVRTDQPMTGALDRDGTTFWYQPGCCAQPWFSVTASEQRSLRQLAAANQWQGGWGDYADAVASGVDHALATLDVDPPQLVPGVHQVDCGADIPRVTRGYLRTHDVTLERWLDATVDTEPVTEEHAFVMAYDGLSIYLDEHGDQITVTNVVLTTPCDA